ncbi:hypothetical protein P3T76_009046 [Phytophthora citrophthora]|uniref:Helicase-associated domain-containing protein n=1 Tax=Phytophthora citrophthora TaxID=4793 RepID=A0AAD9GJ13_9STRA|nr:hypothetical protein P3T76_009046 [Phytophthora citrophthora]
MLPTVNPALRTYLELKHDFLVPVNKFIVPKNDDSWPKETCGYPLGKHLQYLRHCDKRGDLPDFTLQDLKDMNFTFDSIQYRWDHYVLPALRHYYELNKHSDVPKEFRVKFGDEQWPEKFWGYRLGQRVRDIRNSEPFKVLTKADKEDLARIKFCFNLMDREWETRLLPSLVVYSQEFGNCNVPQKSVGPDFPPCPKAAAGLRLGGVANDIRSDKCYAGQAASDADILEKVGFVWSHPWAEWNERIFALEAFKAVEGHNNITYRFMVPSTSPWPEKLHGVELGILFSNIRHYSAAIGYEFPIRQEKWVQRVEPMLVTFEELHGHWDGPVDFVVPSETPWKEQDWGIQLGELKRWEE